MLFVIMITPAKGEPGYAADPQKINKVRRVIEKFGLNRLR